MYSFNVYFNEIYVFCPHTRIKKQTNYVFIKHREKTAMKNEDYRSNKCHTPSLEFSYFLPPADEFSHSPSLWYVLSIIILLWRILILSLWLSLNLSFFTNLLIPSYWWWSLHFFFFCLWMFFIPTSSFSFLLSLLFCIFHFHPWSLSPVFSPFLWRRILLLATSLIPSLFLSQSSIFLLLPLLPKLRLS